MKSYYLAVVAILILVAFSFFGFEIQTVGKATGDPGEPRTPPGPSCSECQQEISDDIKDIQYTIQSIQEDIEESNIIVRPTTITAPGSYKVGVDFRVPSGQIGIDVRASNVIIDLNNKVISGNGQSGDLIQISENSEHVFISNGMLTGSGEDGIHGYDNVQIENVKVTESEGFGIRIGDEGKVANSYIANFKGDGIILGGRTRVIGNTVVNEPPWETILNAGIRTTGFFGEVTNNRVYTQSNGFFGIRVEGDMNLVTRNELYGVSDFSLTSGNRVGQIKTSVQSWESNQDPEYNTFQGLE